MPSAADVPGAASAATLVTPSSAGFHETPFLLSSEAAGGGAGGGGGGGGIPPAVPSPYLAAGFGFGSIIVRCVNVVIERICFWSVQAPACAGMRCLLRRRLLLLSRENGSFIRHNTTTHAHR